MRAYQDAADGEAQRRQARTMPDWMVGGPSSLTRYAASGELAAVTATIAAGCQLTMAALTSAIGGAFPTGAGPPPGMATGSPAPSAAAANGLDGRSPEAHSWSRYQATGLTPLPPM